MTSIAQTENINKPSGKFSPFGMLATLFGGAFVGIIVGLVFYGLNMVLPFGIPLVFPAIAGGLTGYATLRLGSSIGRCRNPLLAVCVAMLAGAMAWGTEHTTDYLRFHAEAYNSILKEYPQAPAEKINLVIDEWLKEKTGQSGFVGFMLLKANSNSVEITHITGGSALSAMTLSGFGLMAYWFVELMITAGVAGVVNRDYAKAPYCDNCNAWRKYRTPVIGTDANLEETIEQFQQRNIAGALESLGKNSEGNITRLETEFCPVCYDSKMAQLVVVKDTGPKTWVEKTAWADKLEPRHIRQILESA